MAKNITLFGTDYENVPAIVVPQTSGGTAKFTDTSGVTATAADVVSGKTIVLADGTTATGTYSGGNSINIFPYLYTAASIFRNSTLPTGNFTIDFENHYPASMQEIFYGATINGKLIIKNLSHPENAGISFSGAFRNFTVSELELVNCNLVPSNVSNMFRDKSVTNISGGKVDMSYCTGSPLESSSYMQNIEFVENSIHADFSLYMCRNLTLKSLISIANGLNAENSFKLTISYSNLNSKFQTLGNNDNGTFVENENGTMTLESFITTVKGWTIQT